MCHTWLAVFVAAVLVMLLVMRRIAASESLVHFWMGSHRPKGPEAVKKCKQTGLLVGICSCGKYIALAENPATGIPDRGWQVDPLQLFSIEAGYSVVDAETYRMLQLKVTEA
jgi:hypothetical protein